VDSLFQQASGAQALEMEVDLEAQELRPVGGQAIPFEVDEFRKHCLLEGLDDIGLTLQHSDEIKAFEQQLREQAPWVFA
jgi:3-isopropylmalate/(R)-2-methylmalate dehydratase small subunit